MNKAQPDLAKIMTPKSLLLKDLLRLAPSNLRDGTLPLTHLEDVVSLFDAAEEGSFLPQAVLMYQMEAYNDMID